MIYTGDRGETEAPGILGKGRLNNPTLLTHSTKAVDPNTPEQGKSRKGLYKRERMMRLVTKKRSKKKHTRLEIWSYSNSVVQ